MKKICPALIALLITLCAFAATFLGRNASVFADVANHPERRAALDAVWFVNEASASAVPAVISALVFIAAYFYLREKKNKADDG
ncbi:MAG: hypothetical protein NC319_04050 [Butyricicoccus sp.]|nr:hypothetical protein [Butyricicoccus sp.]